MRGAEGVSARGALLPFCDVDGVVDDDPRSLIRLPPQPVQIAILAGVRDEHTRIDEPPGRRVIQQAKNIGLNDCPDIGGGGSFNRTRLALALAVYVKNLDSAPRQHL